MPSDGAATRTINEPMKIPLPRWDMSMDTGSPLTATSYDMGDRMKFAAVPAAYPQTVMAAPWYGSFNSQPWYASFTSEANSLDEQPEMISTLKAPPGLEHFGRQKSGKDSDDGYDSSRSTCEASEDAGSSFSSLDEVPVSAKSSLEHSETLAADPPSAHGRGSTGQFGNCHQLNLSALSWAERSNLVLPFISGWAQFLGLTQSQTSIMELQRLILEHPAALNCSRKMQKSGGAAHLRQSLEKLPIHELIQLMTSQEAPPSVQLSIDTLAFQMQEEMASLKRCKPGSKTTKRRR